MTKLAVFDFDSTLMDGETIDFLAKPLGVEKSVSEITEKAMSGELDFFKSLVARAALLEGLEESKMNAICSELPLMPGAFEVVAGLKERGYTVVCFSGGFRNATKPVCEKLGIVTEFSNFLHSEGGILTGQVGGEMMYSDAKGDMIVRIQKILGVSRENTLVVGDGANDLSMFLHADTCVAFCAKSTLKNVATHHVDEKDLTQILLIVDGLNN